MSFNYKEKLPSESQGWLIEKRSGVEIIASKIHEMTRESPYNFLLPKWLGGNKIYA